MKNIPKSTTPGICNNICVLRVIPMSFSRSRVMIRQNRNDEQRRQKDKRKNIKALAGLCSSCPASIGPVSVRVRRLIYVGRLPSRWRFRGGEGYYTLIGGAWTNFLAYCEAESLSSELHMEQYQFQDWVPPIRSSDMKKMKIK